MMPSRLGTVGFALLWASFTSVAAGQDTARTRRPVTSAGDVALTTYNAPAGDTAITRLERFLTQYPQSALRPRAMFQLGELLVRRADDRFAQAQRAGATSDSASRPDYREAIAQFEA